MIREENVASNQSRKEYKMIFEQPGVLSYHGERLFTYSQENIKDNCGHLLLGVDFPATSPQVQ